MSRDSATPDLKEEADEHTDTAVASTSLENFRSTVAEFRFNLEPLTLRRSARNSRQVVLCEEAEYEEQSVKSKEPKSNQSSKRKSGEAEAVVKRKKIKRGYAEPEQYAHLNGLPDILGDELDVLFCGINPGEHSATVGHHFSNPTNHFWRCLFDSGLTANYIPPSDDDTLPDLKLFSLGLTNLVHRPTAEQSELRDAELMNGVPSFLEKVTKHRPYIVCFVGLAIAKAVKAHCLPKGTDGRGIVKVGFQSYKLEYDDISDRDVHETLFYAMPNTSGRVVQFQREDKVRILKEMKDSLPNVKQGLFDTNNMYPVKAKAM